MTVVDERGRVVFENPAAERLTGYGRANGGSVFDNVHPDDLARVKEAVGRSLSHANEHPRLTYRLRHQDARWVTVESICHRVAGESGLLAVIHSHDISDAQRSLARLRHAQRLVTLGRMAAGVADDLDAAIARITTHLAAVLEMRAGDSTRFGVRAIQAAVADASALAAQLLAFAHTAPACEERVDVNAVLDEVRRLVPGHVWLTVMVSATRSHVLIDRASLRDALTDLVLRFHGAMPPRSVVVVSSANLSASSLPQRSGPRPLDYVILEVQNTGRGADAAPDSWLFEPSAVKPSASPVLLSLVILHDIVSAAGGFVEVTSSEHATTTVRVFLPVV